MKNIFTAIFCVTLISCKAQQILPLNTSAYNAPTNSYLKDLNNEFDPFVGTWMVYYQGKSIKLVVDKEIKIPFEMWGKNFYRDRLMVRYEIKNQNGQILEATLNKDFTNDVALSIEGLKTQENGNIVQLIFSGGNCNVGNGFIYFQKINASQFYWKYTPAGATLNDITCPPNLDYKIYLPEKENLVFTKQ